MIFEPLEIDGAFLVIAEEASDERGYFARTFSSEDFSARGLEPDVVEASVSFSPAKGTLRGLHYQTEPFGEAKLIRCVRGAIFDVGVDLRPRSSTFKRTVSVDLREGDLHAVYLPPGVAHGFLTLTDDAEVTYQMSSLYVPGSASGIRWNDPAFEIDWPEPVRVISERDRNYPNFRP